MCLGSVKLGGALVVPIIALCATTAPRQRDSKGLVAWLALATLLHRYSGSSETALDQDLKARRETDPIGALLKNLRQRRSALVAAPSDFSGALADRSGLLALYIACMHRGILDFYTRNKVVLQNAVDRHHILPRAQFPDPSRATADNIANIAFILYVRRPLVMHNGTSQSPLRTRLEPAQLIVPSPCGYGTAAAALRSSRARLSSARETLALATAGRRFGCPCRWPCGHPPGPYASRDVMVSSRLPYRRRMRHDG